ncbi:MAG: hypothetical protein ACREE7_12185 [Dongiaceae bacterium]
MFEHTAHFCDLWDQRAFDPAYNTMPLEAFEPMVRRILAREPYAHGNRAPPTFSDSSCMVNPILVTPRHGRHGGHATFFSILQRVLPSRRVPAGGDICDGNRAAAGACHPSITGCG